jgi:hypothetical protein
MDDDTVGTPVPAEHGLDTVPSYPPAPRPEAFHALPGVRAVRQPPRSDVDLAVPYVHQLWDTPTDFNGHWACGAACAAMVLAYYRLLAPRAIELPLPVPHVNDFGWYVARVFTHEGRTFDALSETRTGTGAGLYGAVVDRIGTGWGAHWRSPRDRGIRPLMDAFLPRVGNTVRFVGEPKRDGTVFMQRAAAEQTMRSCLEAGHPLIVSGRFTFRGTTYDHLVVVRGYFDDPATAERHWIVNDPYGFETTGAGFDGEGVGYTFDELAPKWLSVFQGTHLPERPAADPAYVPVRLFDPVSNRQIGDGTLIDGTDKVYVRRIEREEG